MSIPEFAFHTVWSGHDFPFLVTYSEIGIHFSKVFLLATLEAYLHTLPVAVPILKIPGRRRSAVCEGAKYSPLSRAKRPT